MSNDADTFFLFCFVLFYDAEMLKELYTERSLDLVASGLEISFLVECRKDWIGEEERTRCVEGGAWAINITLLRSWL